MKPSRWRLQLSHWWRDALGRRCVPESAVASDRLLAGTFGPTRGRKRSRPGHDRPLQIRPRSLRRIRRRTPQSEAHPSEGRSAEMHVKDSA